MPCGTSATRPCAIFDLGALVGASDLARFRQLTGKLPGPKCALCTGSSAALHCTAGTSGSCN